MSIANHQIKTVFHVDLDSFFVSAERLRRPSLVGKKVAVGGPPPRGVIASCSYEARRFGVRSAMATSVALRLCPELVLCEPDHESYSELSHKVFSIIGRFCPIVEPVSVDEAYLDMTGMETLFGPPEQAAQAMRKAIRDETGLTASVGIAANRLVAKIATDACKPDNILRIMPGTEAQFLAPLGVERIPGCGRVTQGWLKDRGITTIAELQRYPVELLRRHLGAFGDFLHDSAFGRGSTDFFVEAKKPSMSREITFDQDLSDRDALEKMLWTMCNDLAKSLRAENTYARVLRVKLRYPPFTTVTRSKSLGSPTQLAQELFTEARALFRANWDPRSALRLLGVGCMLGDGAEQLGLFDDHRAGERQQTLERLKDDIQERFGERALRTGRDVSK